jgi:predicted metal-dependent hydrolase
MAQSEPMAPVPAYTLRRRTRRRRTIEISIDPAAGVIVAAPASAAQHEIDAFVRRKARWIKKALADAHRRRAHLRHQLVTDEPLPYLDETLRLLVAESERARPQVRRIGNELIVSVATVGDDSQRREAIVRALEGWYKARAREALSERVAHFAPMAHVSPSGFVVKSQKTRWGSCGKNGQLHFNWHLMLAPARVLDYLVVHELCHLRQRGHGRRFWRQVSEVLPGYAECETELRRAGWSYRLG